MSGDFSEERKKNISKGLKKAYREGRHKRLGSFGVFKNKEELLKHIEKLANLNRGKPCSKETRKKISRAHKGKKLTEETKEKLRKLNIGKKLSEKTKRKMKKVAKEKGFGKWMIGKESPTLGKHWKWSEEAKKRNLKRMQIAFSGKNNPLWKDGISKKTKRYEQGLWEYKEWRNRNFKRDNYTCWVCEDKTGQGYRVFLNVHHLKSWSEYPKLRYRISNGITLCEFCHYVYGHHKRFKINFDITEFNKKFTK